MRSVRRLSRIAGIGRPASLNQRNEVCVGVSKKQISEKVGVRVLGRGHIGAGAVRPRSEKIFPTKKNDLT